MAAVRVAPKNNMLYFDCKHILLILFVIWTANKNLKRICQPHDSESRVIQIFEPFKRQTKSGGGLQTNSKSILQGSGKKSLKNA